MDNEKEKINDELTGKMSSELVSYKITCETLYTEAYSKKMGIMYDLPQSPLPYKEDKFSNIRYFKGLEKIIDLNDLPENSDESLLINYLNNNFKNEIQDMTPTYSDIYKGVIQYSKVFSDINILALTNFYFIRGIGKNNPYKSTGYSSVSDKINHIFVQHCLVPIENSKIKKNWNKFEVQELNLSSRDFLKIKKNLGVFKSIDNNDTLYEKPTILDYNDVKDFIYIEDSKESFFQHLVNKDNLEEKAIALSKYIKYLNENSDLINDIVSSNNILSTIKKSKGKLERTDRVYQDLKQISEDDLIFLLKEYSINSPKLF